MQQIKVSSQAPYESAILEIMNQILSSSQFWTNTIKSLLIEKYGMFDRLTFVDLHLNFVDLV